MCHVGRLPRRILLREAQQSRVAIVDFGTGNLFSVKQACTEVGLCGFTTESARDLLEADAVILPGVGAFSEAMAALARLDLISPLLDVAASEKPLVGICLGMQLLLSESHEFGRHCGLGIIEGEVIRLKVSQGDSKAKKVPQIGWNQICSPLGIPKGEEHWEVSLLRGLPDPTYMYFVHSFVALPENRSLVTSVSRYGENEFCSSLSMGNIFASQFHPERSGLDGLRVYRNLAEVVAMSKKNIDKVR